MFRNFWTKYDLNFNENTRSRYFVSLHGQRFSVYARNAALLIIHFDNVIKFAEEVGKNELGVLLMHLKTNRLCILAELQALAWTWYAFIVPHWQILAKPKLKICELVHVTKHYINFAQYLEATEGDAHNILKNSQINKFYPLPESKFMATLFLQDNPRYDKPNKKLCIRIVWGCT